MNKEEEFTKKQIEDIKKNALNNWLDYADNYEIAKKNLKIMVKGKGLYLYDIDGNKYIDAVSSVFTTPCGHGRKEVADAVYEQMCKLEYSPSLKNYYTEPPIRLSKKLAEISPGKISRSFLVNSGSEANETAFKIAKQYFWQRGEKSRYKIVARRNSYHGSTYGALSATGLSHPREPFEPLVPGFIHVMNAWCYCCELGLEPDICGLACLKNMEQTVVWENPDTIAAIIIDPLPFSHIGYPVPPEGYLKGLRELCDKYGILLIFDEVQTGFGKTGKMFACEHWDVVPDILVIGKGFSGGYLPIAAAITTPAIADGFWEPGKELRHGHTQGGHPVSCVAALKNIEIIEKENLVNKAAEMGKYMRESFKNIKNYPIVGSVQGLGLLFGIVLVQDKNKKRKINPGLGAGKWIMDRCYEKGVIIRENSDVLAISPPLNIGKKEADIIIRVIDETIFEAVRHFNLK